MKSFESTRSFGKVPQKKNRDEEIKKRERKKILVAKRKEKFKKNCCGVSL
jgi:hypothetical protein